MPKRITPPSPSSTAWLISSASMSGENWQWPGMEPIGTLTPRPRPHEQRQDQIGRREPRFTNQLRALPDDSGAVAIGWWETCLIRRSESPPGDQYSGVVDRADPLAERTHQGRFAGGAQLVEHAFHFGRREVWENSRWTARG